VPLRRARIDQLAAQQVQRGRVVKLDIMKRIREDLRQPHQSGLHALQEKQVQGPEQQSAEAYRDPEHRHVTQEIGGALVGLEDPQKGRINVKRQR